MSLNESHASEETVRLCNSFIAQGLLFRYRKERQKAFKYEYLNVATQKTNHMLKEETRHLHHTVHSLNCKVADMQFAMSKMVFVPHTPHTTAEINRLQEIIRRLKSAK